MAEIVETKLRTNFLRQSGLIAVLNEVNNPNISSELDFEIYLNPNNTVNSATDKIVSEALDQLNQADLVKSKIVFYKKEITEPGESSKSSRRTRYYRWIHFIAVLTPLGVNTLNVLLESEKYGLWFDFNNYEINLAETKNVFYELISQDRFNFALANKIAAYDHPDFRKMREDLVQIRLSYDLDSVGYLVKR